MFSAASLRHFFTKILQNLFSVLEFIFVFVFLILPSLFVSEKQGGVVLDFSHGYKAQVFILFLISVVIFLIEKKFLHPAQNDEKSSRKNSGKSDFENCGRLKSSNKYEIIMKIGNGTLCLGMIFFVSAAFQAIGFFVDGNFQDEIVFPKNAFYFINFVFGTFCAAFTEEIFYRFYLPSAFKKNLKILSFGKFDSQKSKPIEIFIEIISVLIFAFSHRYLGLLAVLNAFFAGAILRFCLIKSKSVFIPTVAHFIYNLFVFFVIKFI